MAYRIYTTRGFILDSYPAGEMNKSYVAYTRELGLVYPKAQSVRKLSSKLRFGLEKFSLPTLSLVRGRHDWRLTTAQAGENVYSEIRSDKRKLAVLLNTTNLLRRLIVGEVPDPKLYDAVVDSLSTLKNLEGDTDTFSHFEILFVLRILYHLGYVGQESEAREFGAVEKAEHIILSDIAPLRRELVKLVNQSLQQTQL